MAVHTRHYTPSMEPRPFSHGYVLIDTAHRHADWLLQWSHDLSAMDTRPPLAYHSLARKPSMEPRPFSHGYLSKSTGLVAVCCTFNGATTFQPWILDTRSAVMTDLVTLQWSHDLSAMDTRHRFAKGLRCTVAFNGATTFQPWILHRYSGMDDPCTTFNGATTFQPWIPGLFRL